MAGSVNRSENTEQDVVNKPAPREALVDVDIDALDASETEIELDEEHLAFKKPTDVRRRLEEKLEISRLKD